MFLFRILLFLSTVFFICKQFVIIDLINESVAGIYVIKKKLCSNRNNKIWILFEEEYRRIEITREFCNQKNIGDSIRLYYSKSFDFFFLPNSSTNKRYIILLLLFFYQRF